MDWSEIRRKDLLEKVPEEERGTVERILKGFNSPAKLIYYIYDAGEFGFGYDNFSREARGMIYVEFSERLKDNFDHEHLLMERMGYEWVDLPKWAIKEIANNYKEAKEKYRITEGIIVV